MNAIKNKTTAKIINKNLTIQSSKKDDWVMDKNSSEDEIANVNFLRRYGTYVLQNTKKENLLRLTN